MTLLAPGKTRRTTRPAAGSQGPPLEHALLALLLVFATLLAFYVSASDSAPQVLYQQNRIDPLVFRAAGNLLRDGRSPYSLENQMQDIAEKRLQGEPPPFAIPFSYPPNSLPLFRLRAIGDPALNAALHVAATVFLSLLALSLLVYRYIEETATRLVILFAAAFWTPALLDIELAQTGHLVAALACLVLWLFDRKPLLAGIVLGLLAFKPQYAIPLGLVALARQSAPLLISAAVTFLITCLISALLYGWDMWPEFWRSASSVNTTIFHMESWLGVAALLLPEQLGNISRMAIPVYGVAMLLLGITLFRLRHRLDLLGSASLAIVVTILWSPNTHPYDMGLFFIPVLYLTRYFSMRIWFMELVFLVFLVPNIFISVSILRFCFLVLCCLLLLWIFRQQAAVQNGNSLQTDTVA